MNLFLRISIVLTSLVLIGAAIYPVANARQNKINSALKKIASQNIVKQRLAIDTLAKLNARQEITKLLQDSSSYVRESAAWALRDINARETIPQITKLLQDKDSDVRQSVIRALNKFDAKESIPEIIPLLNDVDSEVRVETVYALSELGAKEAVPQIKLLLQDKHRVVREAARVALKALGAEVPEKKK
jgi:HEAT repeat protein